MLEVSFRCHKRLTSDQNFWFTSTLLPESWTISLSNAKSHSKLIFGHKFCICQLIFKFFVSQFVKFSTKYFRENTLLSSKLNINSVRKCILQSQNQYLSQLPPYHQQTGLDWFMVLYFCDFLAFREGQWGILEPIMNVEVNVPLEFQQTVMAELNTRQALFKGTEMRDDYITIFCEVNIEYRENPKSSDTQKIAVII